MGKKAARPAPESDLSFEDALEQLEAIIQRIESGQIGLEASIGEYERGVALLRRCRDVLKNAEQRVEELNREVVDASPEEDDEGNAADREDG